VAQDIFSIIPPSVGADASYCLWRGDIGWSEAHTTSKTLCENILLTWFADAYNWILLCIESVQDWMETESDIELNQEPDDR
jgi:hypothetical protein